MEQAAISSESGWLGRARQHQVPGAGPTGLGVKLLGYPKVLRLIGA